MRRPDQQFERDVIRDRKIYGTRLARASGALGWEKGDSVGDPIFHFQMKHSIHDKIRLDHQEWLKTVHEADRLGLTPVLAIKCQSGSAYLLPGDTWEEDWGSGKTKTVRDFRERGVLWWEDVLQFCHELTTPQHVLPEFRDGSTVVDIARYWRTTKSNAAKLLLQGLATKTVYCAHGRYYRDDHQTATGHS